MPPQAKIWTAKTQPRLAAFNVRGTTAGKVSLPAIVSDGPGKGRQVNCEIPPNELDAVHAVILKAIQTRDAERAWREGRETKVPKQKKAKKADEQSGIELLQEMLTLEPVKANGHGGARRMINPPNPEKKMMKCLCGCNLQHFNINGFVYGHKQDKRAKASR